VANTWGVNTWGLGNYGEQDNITIEQIGISTTVSIGELAYSGAGTGWGRFDWGSGSWGIAGTTLLQGQQLTSSIGTITVEAQVAQGWGREEWGEFAWGDNYSVIPQGQQLTSAINSVSIQIDSAITAASQQILSITQGLESIQIDADIFVFVGEPGLSSTQGTTTEKGEANVYPTGISNTSNVGQVVAGTIREVDVTGISASLTLGTFTLVQSTNEPVTGQAMTLSLGTPAEIPDQIVGVTGQQLTSGIGSVSITGTANISLTGIALTSNIGSLNITAWAEIDLGVNNVWTEVDLAA
jgi:hypothetical protein